MSLLGDGEPKGSLRSLTESIKEIVERLGYECVHAEIGKEDARQRVQVLIDSLGGINIADCETVSKALNQFLDEGDFPNLEERYYLEVSSPGVERPLFTLEHYERFKGREVHLRLSEPVEGRKSLTGNILSAEEDTIVIDLPEEEREIVIPFGKIKNANLVFRGLEPQKPRKKGSSKGKSRNDRKRHEEEL